MARLRSNNVFGTLTNNPLTNVGTTMNAAGLANLAAVVAPDVAVITLDPNRVNGAPEIVYVTAHTGSATSATILRGQEGTAARQHPSGTFWVHAPTAIDLRSYSPPACNVWHNVAQAVANATETTLQFNSERYDTAGMHDTVTNNNRITITTAGIYMVTLGYEFAQNGTGARYTVIRKNGTTTIGFDSRLTQTTVGLGMLLSLTHKFAAGDYIETRVAQFSGVSLNVSSGDLMQFSATWTGEG